LAATRLAEKQQRCLKITGGAVYGKGFKLFYHTDK
jgi:hypothetical protein